MDIGISRTGETRVGNENVRYTLRIIHRSAPGGFPVDVLLSFAR